MTTIDVLYVTDQTALGGDTRAEYLTLRDMEDDEIVVHVACPVAGATSEAFRSAPGLRVQPVAMGADLGRSWSQRVRSGVQLLTGTISVARRARRLRPDVVMVGDRPRPIICGYIARSISGARLIYHPQYFYSSADVRRRFHRFIARRADAVVGHSRDSLDSYVEIGVPVERCVLLPNPVDVEQFTPGSGEAARRQLGVPEAALVVGTTSIMRLEKNHRLLIQAFAQLSARRPELHLLLAGDGPVRGELERLCADLGLDGRVTFSGFLPDTSVACRALDIFVMASDREPFGLVTIEAMACGRPVIGTRSGGTKEIIDEGVTGLLIEPGNVSDLIRSIERLCAAPDEREAMGAAGREAAVARFSSRRRGGRLADVVRHVRALGRPVPQGSVDQRSANEQARFMNSTSV